MSFHPSNRMDGHAGACAAWAGHARCMTIRDASTAASFRRAVRNSWPPNATQPKGLSCRPTVVSSFAFHPWRRAPEPESLREPGIRRARYGLSSASLAFLPPFGRGSPGRVAHRQPRSVEAVRILDIPLRSRRSLLEIRPSRFRTVSRPVRPARYVRRNPFSAGPSRTGNPLDLNFEACFRAS